MHFEALVGIAIFTEKVLTWSETNEAIKVFAQIGCPVDEDIKKAHDALGKYLDEMIAVAPDNVMVQA